MAAVGSFLAAGTGSAIHIWRQNTSTLQFSFYAYLNPRTGSNVKSVQSIGHYSLLASVDYIGNVHVWDTDMKLLKHSLGCSNDASVATNKDVLILAGSDEAKIYDKMSMDTDQAVLLRELDFKSLVDCSMVSAMSYRLVTAAASLSELYLVFNNDIVVLDVMVGIVQGKTDTSRLATMLKKKSKVKNMIGRLITGKEAPVFAPSQNKEKLVVRHIVLEAKMKFDV